MSCTNFPRGSPLVGTSIFRTACWIYPKVRGSSGWKIHAFLLTFPPQTSVALPLCRSFVGVLLGNRITWFCQDNTCGFVPIDICVWQLINILRHCTIFVWQPELKMLVFQLPPANTTNETGNSLQRWQPLCEGQVACLRGPLLGRFDVEFMSVDSCGALIPER